MSRLTLYSICTCLALLALWLAGCKSGGIFGGFKIGPNGNGPAGEQHTFATYDYLAFIAFVPGMILLVASAWFKPLREMGVVLLMIGLVTAAMSFLLAKFVTPIVFTALGLCVLYLGYWGYDREFNYRRPRARLFDELGKTEDANARVRLYGQIELLDQLYGRKPLHA